MKKNVGTLDRALRLLGAMIVGVLYFSGQINGTAAILLGIIAVLLIVTSLVSYCPAYPLMGISTLKRAKKMAHSH